MLFCPCKSEHLQKNERSPWHCARPPSFLVTYIARCVESYPDEVSFQRISNGRPRGASNACSVAHARCGSKVNPGIKLDALTANCSQDKKRREADRDREAVFTRNRRDGFVTSSIAIETRRLWPPETPRTCQLPIGVCMHSVRPISATTSSTRARFLVAGSVRGSRRLDAK
jgi:hypothetical protein